MVFVGEPTNMEVVNAHKGIVCFRTRVRGLEAHSSASHRGVNAVQHAARLIAFLTDMAEEMEAGASPESGFDPPYTTIHVGTVQGGHGTEHRAARLQLYLGISIDARGRSGTKSANVSSVFANETVLPRMHAVDPDTGIETEHVCTVPGLEPDVGSPAESAAMALGAPKPHPEVVAYGTEGGQFQQAGMPTVVCGPGSIRQAHQPNEYIELSQVRACEAFLRRLLDEICAA